LQDLKEEKSCCNVSHDWQVVLSEVEQKFEVVETENEV
jgi:hypothetical protein